MASVTTINSEILEIIMKGIRIRECSESSDGDGVASGGDGGDGRY